jgi:hypothetical protein
MEDKTLQECILELLNKPAGKKDGHVMTAKEAIATTIIRNALSGDIETVQFIIELEEDAKFQKMKPLYGDNN